MNDHPNAEQAAFWNEVLGPAWVRLQARLEPLTEPLGAAALRALDPRPGENVLDIGCGCGATSWELAAHVGAAGRVLGVDLSGPMLAAARDRQGLPGAATPRFIQADAQSQPFEAAAFDAAFSRFGVMFFSDPVAAFANIRRALRPAGRLAFVAWRSMAENPLMLAPLEGAAEMIELPAQDPLAPGPFAFADGDRIGDILGRAGYESIAVRPHDIRVGGESLEGALDLALRMGPVGAAIRENPDLAERLRPAVRASIARYQTLSGVWYPAAVWNVTARNQ